MSKKDNHENPLYLSLKTSYETLEQGLQSKQQLYQAYGEKAPQDENVNKIIAPKLKGMNPENQKEIDDAMNALDGTPNKSV